MPLARTLKTMDLTNGEFGTICGLVDFLIWMKGESAPIPDKFDGSEIDHLMVRYIEHVRCEQKSRIKRTTPLSDPARSLARKRWELRRDSLGGRPPKESKCRTCGVLCPSVRQARGHCPRKKADAAAAPGEV